MKYMQLSGSNNIWWCLIKNNMEADAGKEKEE